MSIKECSESWVSGIGSMMPAVIVLILAWAVSDVCRPGRLDTAGYIISLVGDAVRPEFLPCISFLVAGAIAVSIGSSFTTMALLVPMFIPLCWSVLAGQDGSVSVDHPIFLATVGAILAGAIFGDHCSPISDTTVLSSAAAGCNHLQHVATQLPYAILMAACSLLFGYLPIGFGVPWWVALPLSSIACVGAVVFLGRLPRGTSSPDQPEIN
jgi:Na+/H+ antiporter NhaC